MKIKLTSVICIVLALALVFSLAACTNTKKPSDAAYENGGVTLFVPLEYDKLVTVDTPADDGSGRLFSVSEIASKEAAQKLGEPTEGAGWLFTIVRVSEAEMHEMLCGNLNNDNFFAKDSEGNYYLIALPSDVRVVREEYNEETLADWSSLCEWADTVPKTFIERNEGFTAESYGSTELEVCLNRAAYMDGVNYTISTTGYGPIPAGGIDAAPYVSRLTKNAVYEYIDRDEAPDGEYTVLDFPDMNTRFDFFHNDTEGNIVREVYGDGEYEAYYEVTLAEGETAKPWEIMNEWYDELKAASDMSALGYTPDSLIGTWAEKIAGRGMINVEKSAEAGMYDVHIEWSDSAAVLYVWDMKAKAGDGGVLSYENGRCVVRTYNEDGDFTEAVQYENGVGRFVLNSANEIMWEDETGHAGDDTVFISVK